MSDFTLESWLWYAFTLLVILTRFISRILHFGTVRKLKSEDYAMAFLTGLYTVLVAFLNVDHDVSTNLIDPAHPVDLTPQEVKQRTWGSKTVLLVEMCMCAVQWGTKGCVLVLYWRLTQNLREHLIVKLVGVYVGVTYVVMLILYLGVWCRPFHDYWKVPTDNVQCTTALNHLILNLVFNLSSDVMIMAIPLPMLLRQRLRWGKKLLMTLPFSLGVFTMVCAVLSKVVSFRNPYSSVWVFWYCREASTAMIVSNLPYTWGLVRRVFKLRAFFSDGEGRTGSVVSGGQQVQRLEGRSVGASVPRGSVATSAKEGKRSWVWRKMSLGKTATVNGDGDEMVTRVKSRGNEKSAMGRDPNEPSSSDNSTAGSVTKPPISMPPATDAVDRLYNLDEIDDEPYHHHTGEAAMERGYNG